MTMEIDSKGRGKIDKDPDAILDYLFNWADWLNDISDTITLYEISVTGGIISETSAGALTAGIVSADTSDDIPITIAAGGVLAIFSGGTVGTPASATCHITTNGGREEDRTIIFKLRER